MKHPVRGTGRRAWEALTLAALVGKEVRETSIQAPYPSHEAGQTTRSSEAFMLLLKGKEVESHEYQHG